MCFHGGVCFKVILFFNYFPTTGITIIDYLHDIHPRSSIRYIYRIGLRYTAPLLHQCPGKIIERYSGILKLLNS